MEELREYLDNHKGFRLTKEMIEKILKIVNNTKNTNTSSRKVYEEDWYC